MTDEDEDYNSSDESSIVDEIANGSNLKGQPGGGSKPTFGILTLEDNEDDVEAFQRPDVADLYDDVGEGEEDDEEFAGEVEDLEILDDLDKTSNFKKSGKKQGSKSRAPVHSNNSNSANKANNLTNQSNKSDLDDSKKKKKKKRQIGICVSATKYECVRRVGRKLGFKEVEDHEDWTLYWTDTSVSIDRVNQMKRWQKINHFPGMSEICRKDFLTRNMNRMAKLFPKEYSFYPKAWCLPADYADLINYIRLKKNKTYICKPDSGCQGRGIFITKNPNKDIKPGDNYVAQVYVSRPFVIDGFKFDLRVYVAVTSCDPFRVFVYKEGLARFTTQAYEEPTQSNCKDVFMHLTNYAIQKRSEEFIRDEETGTKRRISTINKWLREHGYDVDKLWNDIDDVIIKVLLSAHAVLKHNYRTCFANHYRGSACFEILGYDILLDRKLKPYVLEVNHSPSFTTDSKLDREIKDALIYDTIVLMNIGAMDKRKCVEEERKRVRERLFLKQGKKETKEELEDIQQEWLKQIEKWEDKHMGNFRRIYPTANTGKYDKFYNSTGTLFSETAASRARLEQAKQQIEEISRKNEKNIGLKNGQNRFLNKELRGESPIRKTSTSLSTMNTSAFLNKQNSVGSNLYNLNSTPTTPGTGKISSNNPLPPGVTASSNANASITTPKGRNVSVVPLNNTTLFVDINNINNLPNSNRRLERSNSMIRAQNQQSQNAHPHYQMNIISANSAMSKQRILSPTTPQLPVETWKALEINEFDEMERIQSLKQRESLIRGMGISDFVNKMLTGTPGTTATIPPSLNNFNSYHNKNNASNNQNDANNNSEGVAITNQITDLNNNRPIKNSNSGILANGINTSQPSNNANKLEIRQKNFNPFDNHGFFNDKNLNNPIRSGNINSSNPNNYKPMSTTKLGTNNSFLITNANLNPAFINNESRNRNTKLINSQFALQDATSGNTNNFRYQMISSGNSDARDRNANNPNLEIGNSSHQHQKIVYINNNNKNVQTANANGSSRFPLESLNKIETTASLLNFRVKSAQNLAKQRSTGN